MTLARSAMLLKACADLDGEVTVAGLASTVGLPKSTVSRLMKAMEKQGFIESGGTGGGYVPGPLSVSLARMSVPRTTLVDRLHDMLAETVVRYGHTGYVSILDGADIVAVRIREGTQTLRVVTPAGTRYPAFATAVGRTLLARLDDAAVRKLHTRRLRPPSPNSPATLGDLLKRIARVRQTGVGEADSEANLGVGSVAIAVAEAQTGHTASACISFPLAVCTERQRGDIIANLVAGGRRLGALVGDPEWALTDGGSMRRRATRLQTQRSMA